MERTDYYKIGLLMLIPVLVFSPLFYTHYYYTDEVLQLWNYRKGSSFAMFVSQGRLLTDLLFRYMYSHIDTIDQLKRLRLFSLGGWLLCIPAWYSVFARVSREEGLPASLPFFATLFLVCSLPFGVSVQWAACMELFLANTCGLLAGYLVYRYEKRGWLPALVLGLISLFFYQNGFGCYLLPFFLQLIARQKVEWKLLRPLLVYLATYLIYFLLFKGLMKMVIHGGITDRASLLDNPLAKVYYLLTKILPGAFYFNTVVYERSVTGRISFALIAGACLFFNYRYFYRSRLPETARSGHASRSLKRGFLLYAFLVPGVFILVYLPSMLIHENYASNRTLLGLDMAVFLWVFVSILRMVHKEGWRSFLLTAAGIFLVLASLNNFRFIFLRPTVDEYNTIRLFIDKNYNPKIVSIDYIRSSEETVRQKYGVQSSWDEYGMSPSYFAWVPESIVRQLIFERTGDRALAEKLIVRVWTNRQAWQAAGEQQAADGLLIDVPAMLRENKMNASRKITF
jgi:hypothetical protein